MDNNLIDMHVHSIYSDGEFTPSELIDMARTRGVKIISITDHDTILGVKNLINSNQNLNGIELITGIEISAKVNVGKMHILGYNYDINNSTLNSRLIQMRSNSINSLMNIYSQIKKDYNISFSSTEMTDLVSSVGNIGRPHLAKLCVKYGYASCNQEAFDKYLSPAYEKTRANGKGLIPEECISLIKEAGGVAVLAHPHSLNLNYRDELILIKQLISYGLGGIEVLHTNNSNEEKEYLMNIVNQYDLSYSGGSDYHGVCVKPDIKLGTGRDNNNCIKRLTILDKIKR